MSVLHPFTSLAYIGYLTPLLDGSLDTDMIQVMKATEVYT